MYKIKIISKDRQYMWMDKYKVGDEHDICDARLNHLLQRGLVEVIEHYRIVTIKKKKCKHCGAVKLVRKKIIL